MVVAKRYPRDQLGAVDRILQACTRPGLAEAAMYAFPRGGTLVTGPSIRLAEAIAQNWGNISFGIRELSQTSKESLVQAYAWDLETNTRRSVDFAVPHKRKARGDYQQLDDPRDIYELVANMGARRMRACILAVVPGDVVEAAVHQCEITVQNTAGVPKEEIGRLVTAFSDFGVTQEQIRKRLGHDLEATIAAEVISFKKIYASLRDGMSQVKDWFEVEPEKDATDRKGSKSVVAGEGLDDIKKSLSK